MAVAAVAIALLWAAFFIVRPTGNPGVAMRDFEAFYGAGLTANHGDDPYGRAIWQSEQTLPGIDTTHDETLPFVGPEAGLPFWRALAHLRFDVAGRIWGAILACALLIVVFGSLALAGAARHATTMLGVAILSAAYGPLISDVALGQIALISAAGIVASLLLLRTRLWPAAALPAACAALQPSLVLPLIARLTDLRALIACALGAALFLAGMLANGGVAGIVHYLRLLAIHGASEAQTVIQITPGAIARGFGAAPMLVRFAATGSAVLAVVLAFVAARRASDPVLRVGIASCALPFVLPFVHEHDFVLTLLPAVCCAIRARGAALALSAVAVTACGVDWLGLGQRPNAELQSVVLACACALGFALAAGLRRESLAGLCMPVLVGAVCILAHGHPVPVWPDTLPPHWQPPASAPVSEVWALEQSVAGLDATNPIWSFLRALVLLSSGMLGVATFLVARAGLLNVDVHEVVKRRERVRMEAV